MIQTTRKQPDEASARDCELNRAADYTDFIVSLSLLKDTARIVNNDEP